MAGRVVEAEEACRASAHPGDRMATNGLPATGLGPVPHPRGAVSCVRGTSLAGSQARAVAAFPFQHRGCSPSPLSAVALRLRRLRKSRCDLDLMPLKPGSPRRVPPWTCSHGLGVPPHRQL